ncbi:receptor-type tyrosine-protein phosphatase beta-like [Glandiceps talaboti]
MALVWYEYTTGYTTITDMALTCHGSTISPNSVATTTTATTQETTEPTTTPIPTVEAPTIINIVSHTTDSISVQWVHSGNNTDNYEICAMCNDNTETSCGDGTETVDAPGNSGTVSDLTPGAEYSVTVTAFHDTSMVGTPSTPEIQRTQPEPVTQLSKDATTTTTMNITWTKPSNSIWNAYEITIDPPEAYASPIVVADPDNDIENYSFSNLIPGRLYDVKVVVVSGDERSDDVNTSMRTYPNPVENLELTSTPTDTDKILVEWDQPDGDKDHYVLVCSSDVEGEDSLSDTVPATGSPTRLSYPFNGLIAGRLYNVTVETVSEAISEELTSTEKSKLKRTYPNPVEVLELTSTPTDTDTILVEWDQPDGDKDHYVLVCSSDVEGEDSLSDTVPATGSPTRLSYPFNGLIAGRLYNVTVETVSEATSEELTSTEKSKLKRTYPNSVEVLELTSTPTDTDTILVEWDQPDGDKDHYVLVCSSDVEGEDSLSDTVPATGSPTRLSYPFNGLIAGRLYNVTVETVSEATSEELTSTEKSKLKRTYPNPVVDLELTSTPTDTDTILVEWDQPDGDKDHYVLVCSSDVEGEDSLSDTVPATGSPTRLSYPFNGLIAGRLYTVTVETVSGVESSEELKSTEKSGQRRTNPESVTIDSTSTSTDSFTVRWTRGGGDWTGYRIVYTPLDNEHAQTDEDNIDDPTMMINSHVIEFLYAGTEYTVDVYTVSDGIDPQESVKDTTTDRTVPATVTNVTATAIDTYFIELAWFVNETSVSDGFIVNYTGEVDASQRTQETNDEYTRLDDLRAGDTYVIEIYTISSEKISEKSTPISATTVPLKPGEIETISKTDTKLKIQWADPECERGENCAYDEYQVQHRPEDGKVTVHDGLAGIADFEDLVPGALYNISVEALSNGVPSSPEVTKDRTLPATPNGMKVSERTVRSMLIEWDKPEGEFEEYQLDVALNENTEKDVSKITVPIPNADDPNPSSNITGMDPYTNYKVTLTCDSAEPIKTTSLPTSVTDRTDIAPPRPQGISPATDASAVPEKTTHSITVMFTDNFFTHEHGPVVNYSVIVVEDGAENKTEYHYRPIGDNPDVKMATWSNAQDDPQRYQINEKESYPWPNEGSRKRRSEGGSETVKIVIGNDKSCSSDDSGYCNGKLDSGTAYRYQFRGYTVGGYSDTPLSERVYTNTDLTGLWVFLGVFFGIILAAAVVLGILYYLRIIPFKRSKGNGPTQGVDNPEFTGLETVSPSQKKKIKHSKPIKLARYDEYFRNMSADSEYRFSEEYEDLREVGREQTWDAAELAANRSKNRYTNILPYDRTRIKLDQINEEEESDYINANWMPGYNSPREFIAAQGPLPGTRDEFWRMVWENNVRNIVMVTQCQEKGRVKCDHYWPFDNEPVYYGDVMVFIEKEQVNDDWTIRDLMIENDNTTRRVRHYNYMTWPDHGVPDETDTLLEFVRTVRSTLPNDNTPTVVHCSAGVGRTGTFIALDRLIHHMKEYDYVDIYGIVCEMRMNRVFMIQTEVGGRYLSDIVSDAFSHFYNSHL